MLPAGLLTEILAASRSIHHSGSLSPSALIRLAKYLGGREVRSSAETGAGASTLVFSRLSRSHTVFAVDCDESITRVLEHPLLVREATTFIEGPTQRTLPQHLFRAPLQAVLLDGPHAYPFPDLEYFYLYPHLETGALLAIDDIQIPSIRNLFRVVSCDDMFRLLDVCGNTAFLERTEAPVFDPWGDGWWLQRFNRPASRRMAWLERLKRFIPPALRPAARRNADRLRIWYRGGG